MTVTKTTKVAPTTKRAKEHEAARAAAADAIAPAKPATTKPAATAPPTKPAAIRGGAVGSFVRYGRVLRRNGHNVVGYDTTCANTKAEKAAVAAWMKEGLVGRFVVVDHDSDLRASSDTWAIVYAATATWGDAPAAKSVAVSLVPGDGTGTLVRPVVSAEDKAAAKAEAEAEAAKIAKREAAAAKRAATKAAKVAAATK